MMHQHWKNENRSLSRRILQKIDSFPVPVKTALGLIPFIGNVTNLAFGFTENQKFAIVKLAQEYDRENKLSIPAKRHLHAYLTALQHEQRAYNSFLKTFEKHV